MSSIDTNNKLLKNVFQVLKDVKNKNVDRERDNIVLEMYPNSDNEHNNDKNYDNNNDIINDDLYKKLLDLVSEKNIKGVGKKTRRVKIKISKTK